MKALSLLNRLRAHELACNLKEYTMDARDHDLMILESWCGESITRTKVKGGSYAYVRQLGKQAQKKVVPGGE